MKKVNPLYILNPLHISKIKFGNGQGGRVLVAFALKLFTFKKCTHVKKKLLNLLSYTFIFTYYY